MYILLNKILRMYILYIYYVRMHIWMCVCVCVCVPDELENGWMDFDNFFYLLTMDPGKHGLL